jgi:hypothetical protein
MAGLGTPTAPQAAPQQDAAPAPDDGAGQQATPEEQAMYEKLVHAAQDVLIPDQGQQVSSEILANLKGDFDPQAVQLFAKAQPPLTKAPQDCLAATTVLVVLMVDANTGQSAPDDVVEHAGKAIMEMLADISTNAKIHDFDDQELEGAAYRAMDLFRIASPRVNPDELKAQFQQLIDANNAGKLHDVLPGLPGGPALDKGAAAQPQPQPAPQPQPQGGQ